MNVLYWQMTWVIEAILLLGVLGIYFARRERLARVERLRAISSTGAGVPTAQDEFVRVIYLGDDETIQLRKSPPGAREERASQQEPKHK